MDVTIPKAVFSEFPHPKVSENYRFIPTHSIITALQDEGYVVSSAQSGRSRSEDGGLYTKHLVRMRKMGQTISDIVPEVVIVNSHNRTSALRIAAGIFRIVCANGLIAGTISGDTGKVYHNGKFTMDDVIDSAINIASNSYTRLRDIDAMKSRVLTYNDAFEMAHDTRNLLPNGHVIHNVEQLITPRRVEDVELTVWNIFNRIQENVMKGDFAIHGLRKGLPILRKARPVQNIDRNVKLNQQLWDLAVEYSN